MTYDSRIYGTCSSHTGLHVFRSDPDPCTNWVDHWWLCATCGLATNGELHLCHQPDLPEYDDSRDWSVLAFFGVGVVLTLAYIGLMEVVRTFI
jgi:hypothetical protein